MTQVDDLRRKGTAAILATMEFYDVQERELRTRAEAAEARAAELERELAAVSFAAHMPADWPHGLSSWIDQRLYAAYIGAYFSEEVRAQLLDGRLTIGPA